MTKLNSPSPPEHHIMSAVKKVIRRIGDVYIRYLCKREYTAQRYAAFNERAVEYRFVFQQLARYCPKEILDVGTGMTALPHLMANCGFVVTAIDNIKDFWPQGITNRHFYVINDDITSPKLQTAFDMITCVSVLEHIEKFDQAVRSMFSLLRPGGHLILTFPYNETCYAENVYMLEGSSAPRDFPFITQAFSRRELNQWIRNNNARLIDQEYWRYFTGEYWTVGARLPFPEQVQKDENHQITCILLKKGGSGNRI
jgi:2-polyprenyl-3-methyl-5-hydroxy-6-metoxy-1,4-benzoquinol methylase